MKNKGEISDGYHTFNELYEHRHTLFIALCSQLSYFNAICKDVPECETDEYFIWRSKLHSDGSGYDGWFILGIGTKAGEQITYHLPLKKWKETDFAETLEKAPEYDGHTSNDVLMRLKEFF